MVLHRATIISAKGLFPSRILLSTCLRSKTPLNHWPSCQLLSPADYVLAYYSGYTYMLAGTLGVCIYFMAFSWTSCSRCRYMSAGTFRACMIFPARWLHHLYVKMLFSALHYSTWSQEGFQTLA